MATDDEDPTAALHEGVEHLIRAGIGAAAGAAQVAAHRREDQAREDTLAAHAAERQARADHAGQLTRARVAPGLPDTSRVAPGITPEALAAFHPASPDLAQAVDAGRG